MKSMKEYLTGISLCIILFIAGGCSNENELINSSNNEDGKTVLLTIRATASRFEGLPETEKSDAPLTRTPTEDGNSTQFATGDAIGIFAIKGGAIVDNINNSKLTYDATKNWNPDASTSLYYYANVSYIAYYPYKDGITIDATKTTDEIIASLAANSKLQPGTNQAAAADYTACDLMTASGKATPDSSNPDKQVLTLSFKHQFSLLVLVPRVFVECYAPPTGAGFVYRTNSKAPIADSDAKDVTLNGVTPRKMSDGSYRAIVNTTTSSSTLNGSYKTKDDRTIDYTGNEYAAGFSGGNCYLLNVDSPLHGSGSVERALAPGDFVFQNESQGRIEVYPGDGPLESGKIPDYSNAIGIVVTCDKSRMTDTGCKDGSGNEWNHAYVMGLVNAANNINWGPAVDESVLPNMTRANGAANDMNGYTETEAMLAERATKGDLSSYGAFNAINTYRTGNPVPAALSSVRSPWFIPSIGQWFDVMANICGQSPETFGNNTSSFWFNYSTSIEMWDTINSQLSKVNKPLINFSIIEGGWQVIFYSSSDNYDEWVWCAEWYSPKTRCSLWSFNKSDATAQRVVRPFFAF